MFPSNDLVSIVEKGKIVSKPRMKILHIPIDTVFIDEVTQIYLFCEPHRLTLMPLMFQQTTNSITIRCMT